MRKILIAALVIIIVGAGAILYHQSQTPEKQILGQWTGSYEIGSFDFKEDGTVSISFTILTTEGTYVLDTKNSVITIKYMVLGFENTKKFDYVLDKDLLTLQDQTLKNIKLIYHRADK